MSLIPTANSGAPVGDAYYIENVGGSGDTLATIPTIKGSPTGAVRVGNNLNGLVIRGGTDGAGFIRGGLESLGVLNIGPSSVGFDNVVLTDSLTTIKTDLVIATAGTGITTAGDIDVGGNLVLTNGPAGRSISGYYNAVVPVNVSGAGVFPFANPVGITPGWYAIAVIQPTSLPNNGSKMPGCIGFFDGTTWAAGGYGGDLSTFYVAPLDNHTTLQIIAASAFPGTIVSFAKLMN